MAADPLFASLWTTAQGWLLTYLLHSTLLLGGAWLACRFVRALPVAGREAIWRAALVGGLITATVQVALGVGALGGRMELAAAPPVAVEVPVVPATLAPIPEIESGSLVGTPGAAPAAAVAPSPWPARFPVLIALLWGLGAGLALLRFARARRTLRARIGQRRAVTTGPQRATLDRLMRRAGLRRAVRLSVARGLASPVALGFGRREICLPERAASELTPAQQEVMLAHELAHHLRRDPVWLGVGRWIETLFFFQPLNALACRGLRETAEVLCDAWAAETTGGRRALAECLTQVAEWVLVDRAPLPVPAMAQRGAALEQRVRRLLDDDAHTPTALRPAGRAALTLLPLLLVALLVPAVGHANAVAPTAAIEPPIPATSLAGAAHALDGEMTALRAEAAALVALLDRTGDPTITRGAAALAERLGALETQRAALLDRIRLHLETNR